MALAFKNFAAGTTLGGTNGTVWTTTAGSKDVIRSFDLVNFTGSAQTVTIYRVPNGVTAQNVHIIVYTAVAATTVIVADTALNHVLEAGDSIQGFATLSASIAVNASGMRDT
jgi:hypothetical protein